MSKVQEQDLCDTDSETTSLHRVPEVRPSVALELEPNGGRDSFTPVEQALQAGIKQTEAMEVIATSLKGISTFLEGTNLKSVLQTLAVNGAAQALLGGLTSNAGRKGLDALTMKQNSIEIAHLIEHVFVELSKHASSRSGVKNGEALMGFKNEPES